MAKLNGNFVRNTSRKMNECSLRIPRVTRSIKKKNTKKLEKIKKIGSAGDFMGTPTTREYLAREPRKRGGEWAATWTSRRTQACVRSIHILATFPRTVPEAPASVRRRSTESCYRWEMKFF